MTVENEWQIAKMSDIAIGIYDGPHATPKKTAAGPIFLGISSLHNGRLDLTETEHLSENDFVRWTRRVKPQSNDIVFSYETRIGEAALIPDGLRCCLGRRMALLRPNVTKIDPHFLLYQFVSPQFQEFLKSRTISGSTVDRILLTEFPNFPVVLAPIDEQLAIAAILGALDEKIELNRQMNRTLEAMAQAIFKSWFVDFDPVVAKAAGRQPYGMDAETAASFPDRFVESDIGPIPYGWSLGVVSDLGQVICGNTPSTKIPENFGADVPFITIPDMHGKVFIILTERYLSTTGAESQAKKFIPSNSVCVTCIATPGLVCLTSERSQTNQQINSVVPQDKSTCYFCFWILRYLGDDVRRGGSGGTVFHNLNTANFSALQILMPPPATVQRFDSICEPLMAAILENQKQSQTLIMLRDLLLPKLLSGEIRVPEAEKLVEKAL